MSLRRTLLPLTLSCLLAACSSQPDQPTAPREPLPEPARPPVIEIPQATGAIPRPEPLSNRGNQDYQIEGKTEKVWRDIKHYSEEGTASWLAKDLDGNKTANGDTMDSALFSAAHRNLPLPSYVKVTNLDNGLETIVRVNDRGPFDNNRLIDLSYAAATQLDMVASGEARVRLELINDTPDQQIELVPQFTMTTTPDTTSQASPAVPPQRPPVAPTMPRTPSSPPVSKPITTPAKVSPAQGKMIQVLASGSQARAEAMGKVMTQRYAVPYQVVTHDALFRVLLGPVATDQQATLLEKIRQGGLEQAFIVP
ncbi:septal ring lytic transglycosylase RlpA family protein [Aeromonas cavernicola]|uniref:Endolytic peptidoglycan transglycosylase RlpA n=1 Tax=Aeromonas cavernicola TaxID=1006623 RepID=A0A2H9U561_9GAMM|nr:septal ring lytic transglycosylase RlpA family protein [Aeromonas cavernicola]PJG59186.1 septal ring lytic transglycosylase RlpA [Aeromonas cavernicola]